MDKMNPEVKQVWLKALRSGDYQQGRKRLKSDNHMCCLGVLCEEYRKVHPETSSWKSINCLERFTTDIDPAGESYFGIPPPAVVAWAGLSQDNPTITIKNPVGDDIESSLAYHNDEGASFAEIADIIETQL